MASEHFGVIDWDELFFGDEEQHEEASEGHTVTDDTPGPEVKYRKHKPWDIKKKKGIRGQRNYLTKELLDQLLEKHGTLAEVGKVLGVSRERVRQYTQMFGIKNNARQRHQKLWYRTNRALAKKICRDMLTQYLSIPQCAIKNDVSEGLLYKIVKTYPMATALEEAKKYKSELISKNMRTIRKLRKLRQGDIAEKSSIYQETVSQMENMCRIRQPETIKKIAKALEVPEDMLYRPLEYEDIWFLLGLEPCKREYSDI